MLVVGLIIRLLARVGPLSAGDNIDDLIQSDVDMALIGVAVTVFVLVAVVWRNRQEIPDPVAVLEVLVWGTATLWPQVGINLSTWLGDDRPFNYQYLFAIGLAGSLFGLVSSIRRRASDLPR